MNPGGAGEQSASLDPVRGEREEPTTASHWRVSPLLIWAAVVLFIALSYHYAFEVQPLSRIAQFKQAVIDSSGDWPALERRTAAMGFPIKTFPSDPHYRVIDLCPVQRRIKQQLGSITLRLPWLRGIPDVICTQLAFIHLERDGRHVKAVRYH
ncbi:MAG: hypothetical protein ACR2IE_00530 [Candidatus Sumerlaeaceae bacterium]